MKDGYLEAKDAYIEGYKDCQSTFDNLPKVKAWIARDRNKELHLFYNEPIKGGEWWYCAGFCSNLTEQDLPEGCNPQWEDKEPIKIELTINLKKG